MRQARKSQIITFFVVFMFIFKKFNRFKCRFIKQKWIVSSGTNNSITINSFKQINKTQKYIIQTATKTFKIISVTNWFNNIIRIVICCYKISLTWNFMHCLQNPIQNSLIPQIFNCFLRKTTR